ncbi:lipopolysaccharide assembly protein LapB [Commensalibacter papalotli (ex Botero et al. 2024)]|uniref:Tetratricopeptide repeat protein n=1 Tax=Commensalibacter papalotli (ex Botero et al. 2024) TaxID=2972766 RepID=A0ABN8W3X3_9PROT|nr:hypothetical protein [Commensalibacter papalotli (ex Botero et al. 2024)]CAI3931354.1 unnamed protein product [Commensalibacter papalotli (ex Botero et al. 2024)]CAI3947342.1 unnamed protein product [Commensalibacter papalotli (ex Botero et al. 2024)]
MEKSVWIRSLLVATFLTSGISIGMNTVHAKDVVSNKMAVPLKKAEQLMKQGAYAQADAAIKEAQSISNATPYERDIITQLQIASAVKQNKVDEALAGYSHLLSSSRLTKEQRSQTILAQATMAYRAKKYAQATQYIEQYFKAGGNNPHMQTLLIQSYFLNNDYKSALTEQQKQIDAELKKGSIPAETQWQFMVNCQMKLGDKEGLRHSYMQLALHYPKPEYWSHVISSLIATKGMPPQVELEVWNFREKTGQLTTADEYMTMAELAIQSGYPYMARQAMAKIHSKNLFEKSDQKRILRFEEYLGKIIDKEKADYPVKLAQAEKDSSGNALFALGYDQFWNGQVTEGPKMMQVALTKPLTDRNLALLQYAVSEQSFGQKNKAVTILKTITGKNVPAELASLWLMKLQAK